jgi:hypothetical protein
MTAESGTFQSPGYPETYPNNRFCTYLIEVPPKKAISLEFLDFNLEGTSYPECIHDYLKVPMKVAKLYETDVALIAQIYDGSSSSSQLLGTYCGQSKPDQIVSKFNTLFLEFKTDATLGFEGWKANYSSIDLREEIIHTIHTGNFFINFPF